MFSRWWRFGGDRFAEFDLFADDSNAVTLSQAISAAASEAPDADGSELFGTLRGTVVGLRYYTGVVRMSQGLTRAPTHPACTHGDADVISVLCGQVNRGEMVGLVREPQNPYDRNAVMVTNIYGNQVGHIKKELAAVMAHVMDRNLAKVEG